MVSGQDQPDVNMFTPTSKRPRDESDIPPFITPSMKKPRSDEAGTSAMSVPCSPSVHLRSITRDSLFQSKYFSSNIKVYPRQNPDLLPSPPPDANSIHYIEKDGVVRASISEHISNDFTYLPSPTPSAPEFENSVPMEGIQVDTPTSCQKNPQSAVISWLRQNAGPQISPGFPKKITDLPRSIINKILEPLFTNELSGIKPYQPFYRTGMLAGYVTTGNDLRTNETDEVTLNNVDIKFGIMQTCKLFREVASGIFYASNFFEFRDPHACLWWLKNIGVSNVTSLRTLRLTMFSGIAGDYEDRSCFSLTFEEKWLQVLQYLRNKQRLDLFQILLVPQLPDGRLSDRKSKEEVEEYQLKLNAELRRWRGIKAVQIIDRYGYLGDSKNRSNLELLMSQSRKTAPSAQDLAENMMPLAKLIDKIKAKRQRSEHMVSDSESEGEDLLADEEETAQQDPVSRRTASSHLSSQALLLRTKRLQKTKIQQRDHDFATRNLRFRHYGKRYHIQPQLNDL